MLRKFYMRERKMTVHCDLLCRRYRQFINYHFLCPTRLPNDPQIHISTKFPYYFLEHFGYYSLSLYILFTSSLLHFSSTSGSSHSPVKHHSSFGLTHFEGWHLGVLSCFLDNDGQSLSFRALPGSPVSDPGGSARPLDEDSGFIAAGTSELACWPLVVGGFFGFCGSGKAWVAVTPVWTG